MTKIGFPCFSWHFRLISDVSDVSLTFQGYSSLEIYCKLLLGFIPKTLVITVVSDVFQCFHCYSKLFRVKYPVWRSFMKASNSWSLLLKSKTIHHFSVSACWRLLSVSSLKSLTEFSTWGRLPRRSARPLCFPEMETGFPTGGSAAHWVRGGGRLGRRARRSGRSARCMLGRQTWPPWSWRCVRTDDGASPQMQTGSSPDSCLHLQGATKTTVNLPNIVKQIKTQLEFNLTKIPVKHLQTWTGKTLLFDQKIDPNLILKLTKISEF